VETRKPIKAVTRMRKSTSLVDSVNTRAALSRSLSNMDELNVTMPSKLTCLYLFSLMSGEYDRLYKPHSDELRRASGKV
jgi:hypothetical protein